MLQIKMYYIDDNYIDYLRYYDDRVPYNKDSNRPYVGIVYTYNGNNYLETIEDFRHTPKYQKLYERRKETIERVFADAKEKYAMRYTPYRGIAQVTNWVRLKFAAMNLKKYATHRWISTHLSDFFSRIYFTFHIFKKLTLNLNRVLGLF